MSTQHSPEPWSECEIRGAQDKDNVYIQASDEELVCSVMAYGPYNPDRILRGRANARRIVACVNACAGVPTDALEAGVVREMVEVLERCKEIIDDLECECDSYHGFECSIHKDRELVRGVLAKVRGGAE